MTSFVRLRHVLFLAITIVAIVPAVLLAWAVKGPALDRELAAVQERHLQIARHLTAALERYVIDVRAVVAYSADVLRSDSIDESMSRLLEKFHFDHVCLIDNNGLVLKRVASRSAAGNAFAERVAPRVLEATRASHDPSALEQITLTGVMAGVDGQPRIYIIGPESDGERALAVLRTDYFVALQKAVAFGEHGHAAIVDRFGKVIAHPKEDWRLQIKDISGVYPVQRMKLGETGVARFHSPATNQEMVAGFASVPNVGWGVMIPQPLVELERSAEGLREITLSVVLLGMLASALLSWYLAGRLTRPVLAVTQVAARMTQGRTGAPLELGTWLPHELGSLMHSFNAMVGKISTTEGELRRSNTRMVDFANTAADWFWEMNEQLEFTYLSERFQEVCGVPPSALIGRSPRQIVEELAPNPAQWEQELRTFELHQPFRDMQFPWRRPDGEVRAIASSGRPLFDGDGKFIGYRGAARDVTQSYKLAKELRHQANHDALTGLVNRREFESRLHQAWVRARERGEESALCYMDLDQFKVINDTVGHVAGDAMLVQIADMLRSRVRARDTLARLGGDEFSLLLENCELGKAEDLAEAVLRCLQEYRFDWAERVFTVGISIGLVSINASSESTAQVLTQADLACYTAKDLGRNRVHVFRPEDREVARRHREILHASELRGALEDGRFELFVQRIEPLREEFGLESVYEVLVRMKSVDSRHIAPDVIIPAAERFGLMNLVDRWIIRHALEAYRHIAPELEGLHLSLNLSASSLGDAATLTIIRECLQEYAVPPGRVCFEITETSAIGSLLEARRFMLELKELGCRFALDDFGSGLSSFSYLRQLPVDYLKIDGSFVRGMLESAVDHAMVESVHRVAQTLGIQTIAECVESVEVLRALREVGVDAAQGFVVHRPEPIESMLARRSRLSMVRTG